MNKLLICILVLIILSSGALAATPYYTTNSNLPAATKVFALDNNCNDGKGGAGCTVNNCAYTTNTTFGTGYSLHCNGNGGEYLNTNFNGFYLNDNMSISFWYQSNDSLSGNHDLLSSESVANTYRLLHTDANPLSWDIGDGVGNNQIRATDVDNNSWQHIVLTRNGTTAYNMGIFINGVFYATVASDATLTNEQLGDPLLFLGGDSTNTKGYIDDIVIFNNTVLDISQIQTLFEGNYSVSSVFGGNTLNISGLVPIEGGQFNTNVASINATINSSADFNCSVYINDTLNETITGFSSGNNLVVKFNVTISDGDYYYNISCVNGIDTVYTTGFNFFVDTVPPETGVGVGISSGVSMSYLNNITGVLNFSDDNLYGVNITIDDTHQLFAIEDLNYTTYSYNLSFYPGDYGLTTGVHYLNVWVSDSHTAQEIPDYVYTKNVLSKSLKYWFEDGWITINPTNNGLFSKFNTWKENDRYVFSFEKDTLGKLLYGDDLEFEVTSNEKINLVSNTKYRGHIVSPSLGKWIDFESQFPNSKVTSQQIDDRKIKVTISGIDEDQVTFNSIGGLNIVSLNYSFYYGNLTETFVNRTLETDNSLFTLNFTKNVSFVDDIYASFYFNGTSYKPTKTTDDNYVYFTHINNSGLLGTNSTNYTFYWKWNVTNIGAGEDVLNNQSNEQNQSRYRMTISNCSDGSIAKQVTLNFTTRNQSDDQQALSTTGGLFTVWNVSSAFSRDYAIVHANDYQHGICMFPEWATINTNYLMRFYRGGHDNRDYQIANGQINDSHTNITIYMSTTDETTAITINLVDENDNELENYRIEAHRYVLPTNNYEFIDSKISNSGGSAVFNLDVSTDEYLFKVFNPSDEWVHTESKQLLTSSSYTFRILLGTSPSSIRTDLNRLDYTLTADKNTKNFTLTWDDTTTNLIDQINLTVMKLNVATDNDLLNSESSIANSGLLYYNVSSSGIYSGTVYVQSTVDGNWYKLDSQSIDIREEWDLFGTDALMMSLLFIGTMTFIGFAIGAEVAIIFTIVGMIIFFIMGFIQVGLTGLLSLIVSLIILMVRLRR